MIICPKCFYQLRFLRFAKQELISLKQIFICPKCGTKLEHDGTALLINLLFKVSMGIVAIVIGFWLQVGLWIGLAMFFTTFVILYPFAAYVIWKFGFLTVSED